MNGMSLSIAIGLYHLIGLTLVGLCVSWFYSERSWLRFAVGGAWVLGSGLMLALMISLAPANPLRAARLLCLGWFVHFPIYLVATGVSPQVRGIRAVVALGLALIAAVTWYSFRFEPFHLEVTNYRVQSDKISESIKLGILADFQTDKFGDYEKMALKRFMEEKPDAIFIPGDILQSEHREAWEALRDQMNAYLASINFSAPLGVYAVGGNTDFQRRWPEIFHGLDVATMVDSTMKSNAVFDVIGLSVEDSFDHRVNIPATERFQIALGHAPDFALSPFAGADLMLAGHTHGGQVCVPPIGPIVTFSRVPRSWASGLTRIDDKRTLVVSRGVGMERRDAPRLRFLCRPQLVFVTVEPAGE